MQPLRVLSFQSRVEQLASFRGLFIFSCATAVLALCARGDRAVASPVHAAAAVLMPLTARSPLFTSNIASPVGFQLPPSDRGRAPSVHARALALLAPTNQRLLAIGGSSRDRLFHQASRGCGNPTAGVYSRSCRRGWRRVALRATRLFTLTSFVGGSLARLFAVANQRPDDEYPRRDCSRRWITWAMPRLDFSSAAPTADSSRTERLGRVPVDAAVASIAMVVHLRWRTSAQGPRSTGLVTGSMASIAASDISVVDVPDQGLKDDKTRGNSEHTVGRS